VLCSIDIILFHDGTVHSNLLFALPQPNHFLIKIEIEGKTILLEVKLFERQKLQQVIAPHNSGQAVGSQDTAPSPPRR